MRTADRLGALALGLFLLGATAFLPLLMLGWGRAPLLRVAQEFYFLLPPAVVAGTLCALMLRKQGRGLSVGRLALAALGTAGLLRLGFQLVAVAVRAAPSSHADQPLRQGLDPPIFLGLLAYAHLCALLACAVPVLLIVNRARLLRMFHPPQAPPAA